jgi:hypothetical protein
MNYFRNIINKILPKNLPKPLGRWKIDECNATIGRKIDLSNEDHCSLCGQYAYGKLSVMRGTNKKVYIKNRYNPNNKI